MSFSRRANPVWLFTDLNGNILDDTYYMSFLENTIPYIPKNVYQDDQGLTPWANPLQFHPDGTLPDNLYFEDGGVYRLEIRQGPLQTDPLIRLIENFVEDEGDDPTAVTLPIDNQITNPQFAFISFNESHIINNTGNNSYDIAPGWVLDLESSGAAVLTVARIAIAGDENIPTGTPTNPSYALSFEITSGTFTSVQLRQRFDHTPAIWASAGVSINFTGKMLTNSADISVRYVPSDGTGERTVINITLASVYQFISGGVQLDASDSTDTGDDGYVDIIFDLPISGTCFLTNIQAIGSIQAADYPYAQTTVERQKDHTFHYYADSILMQPKETLLTGWNFSLNPWQFYSTTHGAVAANEYTADQTIIVQRAYVASATGNNVSVSQSGVSNNRAYDVAALTADNKFALIQYIDAATIKQYWGKVLSSLCHILFSSPTHNTVLRVKMRLIYRNDTPYLPPTVAQNEPILSWTNVDGSDPVFTSKWTEIVPENDPIYTLGNHYDPIQFNKFQLPTCLDDLMTLGIVIYTLDNMDETATADSVLFQDISLVNNDFGIKASSETWDESLRKCQYYYEKSYDVGTLPGTVTATSMRNAVAPITAGSPSDVLGYKSFGVVYNTIKRAIVTPKFYSPASATVGFVQIGIYLPGTGFVAGSPANVAITNWDATVSSQKSTVMIANNPASAVGGATNVSNEGQINYHYVADARLGI